jgi:hypothetical protein
MARIKIEDTLEHLDGELRNAMGDALRKVAPEASINAGDLLRAFRVAVGQRCDTWVGVPDQFVD